MIKIKFILLLFLLLTISCGETETNNTVKDKFLTDEQFFSKPVLIPAGKQNDKQRLAFAKGLESTIDNKKFKSNDVKIVAEGEDNTVLFLTNIGNDECIALSESVVIKGISSLGFKTFNCLDTETNVLFSKPIE